KQVLEEIRVRARQQAVLAELGLRALAGMGPQALAEELGRAATDTLGVEFAEVLQLSDDGQTLRLEAGAGWRGGTLGTALPTGADSQEWFTLQLRAPVLVGDSAGEKRFARAPHLAAHGVVAGVTVLIHGDDRP